MDVRKNQLQYAFAPADFAIAQATLPAVDASVKVPGAITVEQRLRDAACNGRNDCWDPVFEAGVLIYKDNASSSSYCTMGFHITVGSDQQFLTAGHCGYNPPDDWHHPGYSGPSGTHVGNELASLYGAGGKDVMRVALLDSRASQLVFAEPNTLIVSGHALPVDGEAVCASRGKSSNPIIGCGVVQDSWDSWTSDTANPDVVVYGADSSIPAIPGDSGSPLYRFVDNPVYDYLVAIGVLDHEGGFFARVSDAMTAWSAKIFAQGDP